MWHLNCSLTRNIIYYKGIFQKYIQGVVVSHSKLMAFSSKTSNKSPYLEVSNDKALVDERINIVVNGLKPEQKITVAAGLQDEKAAFVSYAHFKADKYGHIDVEKSPSLSGTYEGIDSMGLFWSMKSVASNKKGVRLNKKDVTQPFRVKLSVLDDFQNVDQVIKDNDQSVICSCDIERWYLDKNVTRTPIRAGRLRGTLFKPKGNGPFPGVIDLFGSAGGLIEFRAALLGSRGFLVFALAYFDYDDLPKGVDFDFDYFDEAIEWMTAHPNVNNNGLGIIGTSKGAEIALHMACYNKQVKICAAFGAVEFYSFGMHMYKGREIRMNEFAIDKMRYTDEGIILEDAIGKWNLGDIIPFEKSGHCHLLIMQGDDDVNIGLNRTDAIAEILKKYGMSNFTVLNYPDAGHLIEPPYTPLNREVYHKMLGTTILYGGKPVGHAKAQEHSWYTIIDTFSKYLKTSNNVKGPLNRSKL